ncbi:fungal-specific transcription factor domain-containing protein [Aspergillus coremiiformis]|uniref:Fungal-specific transcription factor domain-containing protein n=1 Tax=Aspergillus coremiiformis TaxID=138285 RepID=A0A5N6YYD7_9EURO|nr:fungal-specific transcription factor domain-containing protein [Aspergillus coremiiformis]
MNGNAAEKRPKVVMESSLFKGSRGKTAARPQAMSADSGSTSKRRCVSTACIACRRRKSKCDGNLPSCAACSSVYHTTCVYDPNSDHRRKGVYKKDTDTLRTKNATLLTLIQALLNYEEEEDAFDLVRQIRSCDNLEDVAQSIMGQEKGSMATSKDLVPNEDHSSTEADQFESELAGKMSGLMLDGSRKFIGGTSNLIFLPPGSEFYDYNTDLDDQAMNQMHDRSITQWTKVTADEQLISHLMTMYFTWHYPFFTLLSKDLFYRDYIHGVPSQCCSSLLVNAMLALGCHFSSWDGAREDPQNLATAGDHFFKEAKRLVLENDEHANAKLCTVQALALMSVREAGCGREGKGWVYSGMSFRMALDLGLNFDSTSLGARNLDEDEVDARRITFWGCFLIDKCWSNYLGRLPQLAATNVSVPKIDILPNEEAEIWSPYTDAGASRENTQPSRTRTVALQLSKLCEISGDLLVSFYNPTPKEKPPSKQIERKKLSEIHTRLEAWKRDLPKELEPKERLLPQALLMHMFYQLLFIHLYRPFLKYTKSNSPLPQHVSPRKLCTQAASAISKLLRIYKRTYGFKQICNVAVYMAHTACTIHLLNLPEKNAQRDVVHCLRHLEEMGESWLCARRTLRILDISASKWQVELPLEAVIILEQTHARWGSWGSWDQVASPSSSEPSPCSVPAQPPATLPRSFLSPGQFVSLDEPSDSSMQEPPNALGSMGTQYAAGLPIPASISAIRAAQRYSSAQLARTDAQLPEPTYLRPVSHTYSSMQTVPLPQHDSWYDPQDAQGPSLRTGQDISSTSSTPPVTGFGTPDNLVEESQDWWFRDPSAFNPGFPNWKEGWSSAMAGMTPDFRYVAQTSGSGNTSTSQPARYSIGVPPNTTQSDEDSAIARYNNVVYPRNYQP